MRTTPRRLLAATAALAATAVTATAVPGPALSLSSSDAPALTARQVTGPDDSPSTTLFGRFGAATGNPHAWASRALAAEAGRLGVDAGSVRWESVHRSLVGTHVRGREYRGGVPVRGTDVLVSAIDGRVVQVAGSGSALPGGPTASPVSHAIARSAALVATGVTRSLVAPSLTRELRPIDGRLVDTFAVHVLGKVPAVAAEVVLDAATGRVLGVADDAAYDEDPDAKRAGASIDADVFDPNPVVTSRNTSLRSPFETGTGVDIPLDSAELTAELKQRSLQHLDETSLSLGMLSGEWIDVPAPIGYLDAALGGPLSYSRTDPRFVGLMAYYHVDTYQSWLQKLGIKDVNAEAQTVIPTVAQGYDNSFYQPGNDLILFGGGGVPDAEDAEVILHEYGHAMQDAQVPGYGETDAGGAMGEGFGDFNAANFFALTSGGFNDLCVAEWDATAYSTDDPPCLRRMDSTKSAATDLEGEVHADGEIWSAFLWRVRSHLGRTTKQKSVNAIKLVLTMHDTLLPDAEYADAVAGLKVAAKALHHKKWVKVITKEAKRSGYAS